MRSLLSLGLLTVLSLLGMGASAEAQVFGSIVQPAPVVPGVPGMPIDPTPQVVPTLPAPVLLPVRPLTLKEFASAVKPLPGKYEVLLVHPKTGCPVKVCFTLPPGCIRKVRVNSHRIEFVYKGQRDVVIRFLHGGKVWVRG
ncbi:MAG TPA: hypothetical protein VN688_07690 [Gemmataceae bacterium]|nr:hypothetical protein [Gemmataceae bacterium]